MYDRALQSARRLEDELRALLDPTAAEALFERARHEAASGHRALALELLDRALLRARDSGLRGRIQQLRGGILMTGAGYLEAYELLLTEAAAVERHDRALASEMLATAAICGTVSPD